MTAAQQDLPGNRNVGLGPFTAFQIALLVAIAARLFAFVFTMAWPIPNESGQPVSPLLIQSGVDFWFYEKTANIIFDGRLTDLFRDFRTLYGEFQVLLETHDEINRMLAAAPLFPVLIHVFGYHAGNTLPLATFYLAMAIGLAWLWLRVLNRSGLGLGWLLLFAVLPTPVWFMINISTDLLFAVLFGLFYVCYFRQRNLGYLALAILLAILSALARPNGLALPLFLMADGLLRLRRSDPRLAGIAFLAAGVGAIPIGLYYLPQFVTYVLFSSNVEYFGILQSDYLSGIFPSLPQAIDAVLSIIALAGAKVLYFLGLRPSYGETALPLVLLRAFPGLILLPGLVWAFVRADISHRLLIGLYLLPVLLGASQDRYNLALQPLLFLFGGLALSQMWQAAIPKRASA